MDFAVSLSLHRASDACFLRMIELLVFAALLVGFAFGPGYQTVPAVILPTLVLLLYTARSSASYVRFVLTVLPAVFLGSFLAYAGSFVGNERSPWDSPNTKLMLPIALMFSLKIVLPCLLDRFIIVSMRRDLGIISFPLLWTLIWMLDYHYFNTQFGDFGNWHVALSLSGLEPLTLGATWLFGAVAGGNFVISLMVSLIVTRLMKTHQITSFHQRHQDQKYVAIAPEQDNKYTSYLGMVCLASIYLLGSVILAFSPVPESFYQRPVQMFAPPSAQVSCLVRGNIDSTRRHLSTDGQNSKLVMWSEVSVTTRNETLLIQQASELVEQFNVSIGVAYYLSLQSDANYHTQNVFSLVTPYTQKIGNETRVKSRIAFRYQKTHPVPRVESDVQPGPGEIPTVPIPHFGRTASAICFDLNFPFIDQIYASETDIILQPSATWGPNGPFHAYVNRLRAVENGVTMIRCASNGVSGVYDAFHRVRLEEYTLGRGSGYVTRVPLYGRRWTLYGQVGSGAILVGLIMATSWMLVCAFL